MLRDALRQSAFAIALLAAGTVPAAPWPGSIEALLQAQPERFGTVMADVERHRVQIIYTQIDRDERNRPTFRSYTYRLDAGEYFYPASTVKLPAVLLALEKLERLGIDRLDRDTTMLTGVATLRQTPATRDPGSPTGKPSVGHYARKILLVSDNDAFNRLYEFLGQEAINESMREKGYRGTRIVHRLDIVLDPEDNRRTNPVRFVEGDREIYSQPPQESGRHYEGEERELLGRAEIVGDMLIGRPKDFSVKNEFPLEALHDVVKATMFPDAVAAERRFDLSADDYRFVWRNMSGYPGDSGIADYADASRYPDGYVKFLMFGGSASEIPSAVRIFNKVGDAYGFLTDAAYIVDIEHGIEFLLAATVYTNANETFNDNNYEYDEIGFPFLRDLGQAFYEVELGRERAHRPDLSALENL